MFGKSDSDKGQDEQIRQILQWIQRADKNMAVLIKNNNINVPKNRERDKLIQQLIESVNALVDKDKTHDMKDQEHDRLIEQLKSLGKSLEEEGE